MKIFNNIILLALALVIGCTDLGQNDENFNTSELLRILNEDDAAGMDGFDDGGLIDLDYERGLEVFGLGRITGDTLSYGEGYRIRFGRQITSRERTVDFSIDGDTAIGVVSYLIDGVFLAEAKDTSTMETIDSLGFSKAFTSTMIRKVKYERVDDSNNPEGYSWKIIALTPLYGGAGDKVSITSIDIYEFNLSVDDVTGITTGAEGDLVLSVSTDGIGMQGFDPIANGQLSRDEIQRCAEDPTARLELQKSNLPKPTNKSKGPKYVPISKRGDKPDAIAWLLKHHPELKDSQINRLVGTTKDTINKVRDRTHWNSSQITARHPVLLGLCQQQDLDNAIIKAGGELTESHQQVGSMSELP